MSKCIVLRTTQDGGAKGTNVNQRLHIKILGYADDLNMLRDSLENIAREKNEQQDKYDYDLIQRKRIETNKHRETVSDDVETLYVTL